MWDSEVTNYKTEIHIAHTASKVMWSCNATANEHEGEKCKSVHGLKCYCKGTPDVSTLNHVPTSFGMCYFARHRSRGDHADGTYELPYLLLVG